VILNTNCLPFPLSPGLRAIILKHIADSFMACVLSFHHSNPSPEDDDSTRLAEIAVDTDGSLIYISHFRSGDASPAQESVTETRFNFSRNEAHYLERVIPLDKEQERFRAWEHSFVACYRLGNCEVEILPLLELEEIVTVG
jgi:hypothetical protein